MATDHRLRLIMMQANCPNMEFAEKEFVLTYMLQALAERNALDEIAFKGGTCIRKMLSGPSSRLSTDLDFTSLATDQDEEELVLRFHAAIEEPFHGFEFSMGLERERDWYCSGDSVGFGIEYNHVSMGLSGEIRVQISLRANPILTPIMSAQLQQGYFGSLEFSPANLLRLRVEEMLAEKIRALCQRQKTRDLYDLNWFALFPHNHGLIRGLVVLKLWETDDSFNPEYFQSRLSPEMDWDWDDLGQIVKGFDKTRGTQMLDRSRHSFEFLSELTAEEQVLIADKYRQRRKEAMAVSARLFDQAGREEDIQWRRAHERAPID